MADDGRRVGVPRHGAATVAGTFKGRARAAQPALVNGAMGPKCLLSVDSNPRRRRSPRPAVYLEPPGPREEFDVVDSEGLAPSESTPYHPGEFHSPTSPSGVGGSFSYPPKEHRYHTTAPVLLWWALRDSNPRRPG